uniref:Uncharacterized protein n=1 Tax=Staphylothermus marinus TaxID=2280 RepID=A0A7C4JLM2_STAMA
MSSLLLKIGLIILVIGAIYIVINVVYWLIHFEEIIDAITILSEALGYASSETMELDRSILMTILVFTLICNIIVLIIGVLILLRPLKKKPLGIAALIFSLLGFNIFSLLGSILVLLAKTPKEREVKPTPTREEPVVI